MKQIVITQHGGTDVSEIREKPDPKPSAEKVHIKGKAISKGVEEGWIRPHVDRAYALKQASGVHAYIEAKNNVGKIVLGTDG
jgi:NADPH:quinone reductase-like Zn-dependent oxidoreductase